MRDREIELDAKGSPGPTVADFGLLDAAVGVEHLRPIGLVGTTIEVAAQVGQHRAAQVLILQDDRAVRHRHGSLRDFVP